MALRRRWTLWTLVLLALALAQRPWAVRAQGPPQPNIVVIMTDDQRWDTLDMAYSRDGLTPVMPNVVRELMEHGVTFDNAFATTPLCAPSRASFFTGQYAHTHGVVTNDDDSYDNQKEVANSLLPVALQQAGYRTGLFGKYSNQYKFDQQCPFGPPPDDRGPVPCPGAFVPGWDEWHAFEGQGKYTGFVLLEASNGADPVRVAPAPSPSPSPAPPPYYSTDFLRDQAVQFIQQSAQQPPQLRKPFFLYFAPKAVHGQQGGPPTPATEDRAPWFPPGGGPAPPPSYNEAEICGTDKPRWLRENRPLLSSAETIIDTWRSNSLLTLQSVDRAVADQDSQSVTSLVKALRNAGVDQNTVIIYTSDNGYFWGEHRLLGKQAAYDEATRIPLVIRPTADTPGLPRHDSNLVLNIDLAPTILELAGATALLPPDGRSLQDLIRGVAPNPEWRADFLIEHWDDSQGLPTFAAVRKANRKYVEYVTGEQEFYRHLEDPSEMTNLAYDPNWGTAVYNLHGRLTDLCPGWPPAYPRKSIFASGFECGDLLGWSSSSTGGGDLSVTPAGALISSAFGLQALVNDTTPLFVQDDSPSSESRFRARFYFKPNGFDPGDPNPLNGEKEVLLFVAFQNPNRRMVIVLLRKEPDGTYRLVGRARRNDGSPVDTPEFVISDTVHRVEFDWQRATAPGVSDGYLRLWIDGTSEASPTSTLGGLDNDAGAVDYVRMGAIAVRSNAWGTLHYDHFVSRMDTFIGP